ncbi:hypothetical protein AAD018_002865 [Aestuariibius insulae]|uniref:hypothetical protein n=1 Tax=Aestuariibius insulae TaxID=2058287 RepID=UPI00345EE7AD
MSISDDLDSLREQFPECSAIAFADLSARMVLVTSSRKILRQEALDALCAEASLLFEGAGGTSALSVTGDVSDTAVVATPDGINLFLRATAEPADLLCLLCSPEVDTAGLLAQARPSLDRISSGEVG